MTTEDKGLSPDPNQPGNVKYEKPMGFARSLGVSDVRVFPVGKIKIEDELRRHCEEPRCPNYGSSIHCPPHAMMPSVFRKLLAGYTQVLGFKLDFPVEAIEGDNGVECGRQLHETTAQVERYARSLGFERAKGFSSGGCKNTLCGAFETCAALAADGECRFPEVARTSLSCVGVNFHALSKELGWSMWKDEQGRSDDEAKTVMMVGLVLCE